MFHIITAVWGDKYADLFSSFSIPNQLSAGNLEALPPGSRYRIFTDARTRLDVSRLERVLPVDVVVMPDGGDEKDEKYGQMTRYHRQGAAEAGGAALIFLTPEHVLATNTLKRIVELREAGYRAVVGPALRLVWEDVVAAHQHSFTPRELVGVALRHLHPVSRNHFLAAGLPHYPTHVYWKAPDGLLAHCLNVYPFMVAPTTKRLPESAIDARYLYRAVPDPKDVYLVTDSDDLAAFELTPRAVADKRGGGRKRWTPFWRVASVACRCDPHQLAFWQRPVHLHTTDLSPAWEPVRTEAGRFAARVHRSLPIARRMFPIMNTLRRWEQRLDHRLMVWRRQMPAR